MSSFSEVVSRLTLSLLLLGLSSATGAVQTVGGLTDYGDVYFQTAVAAPLSTPGAQWSQVFRWLQIGDSHTGGDYLTGELRRRLQLRYGDAGIGWITPGYVLNQRSDSVKLNNDSGWTVSRAARQKHELAVPFGGFYGYGSDYGASLRMTFKNPLPRQLMRLSILQPTTPQFGSRLAVDNGDAVYAVPIAPGETVNWTMTSVLLDAGDERLALRTLSSNGVATLGGVALERLAPGVVLDAVGVNGAQIDEFLGWSEDSIEAAFSARPPNLVVLAYGTNESVARNFDAEQFAAKVTTAVRRIRKVSKAAILLMLPPDVRLASPARRSARVGCGQPPQNLSTVNAALKVVARQEKTLLWDWGHWVRSQGGYCGTVSLAHMAIPLARPDYIHLTPEGYRATAASLLDDLLRLVGSAVR